MSQQFFQVHRILLLFDLIIFYRTNLNLFYKNRKILQSSKIYHHILATIREDFPQKK